MSKLTTHILNTAIGKPAAGITVILEHFESGSWMKITEKNTNADGRISDFPELNHEQNKMYRLIFLTEEYFKSRNERCFYPRVTIEFYITDDSHYHVPLLISPYAYSTYRGS